MAKWIFQDIQDIKDNVLMRNIKNGLSIHESTKLYNEALRQNIDAELYVRYVLNQFDVYVDAELVRVTAQHVYPHLTDNDVYEMINKYKH